MTSTGLFSSIHGESGDANFDSESENISSNNPNSQLITLLPFDAQ
jgi:hypothetical protein